MLGCSCNPAYHKTTALFLVLSCLLILVFLLGKSAPQTRGLWCTYELVTFLKARVFFVAVSARQGPEGRCPDRAEHDKVLKHICSL